MKKRYAVRISVIDFKDGEPTEKKSKVIVSRHKHPWEAGQEAQKLRSSHPDVEVVVLRREPKKVRSLPRPYEATHSGGKVGTVLDPDSLNYVYREVGVFLPVARGSRPFEAAQLEAMCNILRMQKVIFLQGLQAAVEAWAALASEQTKEQAA